MRTSYLLIVVFVFLGGCAGQGKNFSIRPPDQLNSTTSASDWEDVQLFFPAGSRKGVTRLPNMMKRAGLSMKLKENHTRLNYRLSLLKNPHIRLNFHARSSWYPKSIMEPRGRFYLRLKFPFTQIPKRRHTAAGPFLSRAKASDLKTNLSDLCIDTGFDQTNAAQIPQHCGTLHGIDVLIDGWAHDLSIAPSEPKSPKEAGGV